ncbi:MAG: hypothetical protein IPG01_04355 [Chitinophagaceae bacterium]|nr:hypothetical protein [Chitinophagaceae bacterium]
MEREEEIQNELNQWAPLLAALPRAHPFNVPANYFTSSEQQLMQKVRETVSEIVPLKIQDIDHPFEHPATYFDELPATILSKIKGGPLERRKQDIFPIVRFIKREVRLIAAAVAAILVFGTIAVLQQIAINNNQQLTTQKSIDESNLILQVAEVDEEVIVNLFLEDQTLDNATISDPVSTDPSLLDVTDIDDEYFDDI